jgi:uncharacterized protein (TIGR00369 family)
MTFQTSDPNFDQKVRANFDCQQFMQFIGARLTRIEPGYCEIYLPYKLDLTQQHGYFHAGIISTMADNAAGYAAFSLMPPGASVLSVEFKLNLLSPGDGEALISRGQVVKAGRTLTICKADVLKIRQGEEQLCATALLTMMALQGKEEDAASCDDQHACPLPP